MPLDLVDPHPARGGHQPHRDSSRSRRAQDPAILIRSSPHKAGSEVTPWQDAFDPDHGHIRYYGDGKPASRVGAEASPGNKALLEAFALHTAGTAAERGRAAGVFNGSVGQVTAISLEDQELRVLLDEDEEVAYGFDELDELTHAYAVSIHRSQGSEYPCVVIPVTTSAWLMLQRNLLYTAVTRAKRIVVLVGSRRALAEAVRTQGAGRRYTTLTDRLRPGGVGVTAAAS